MISAVLQTTAYVLSPDGGSVLMLHRGKRADDVHFGKYIGLGGHVERDEDPVAGVKREIEEESGLIAQRLALRGTVLWTGFGQRLQDILCFVFLVTEYRGEPHGGNEEGTLEWVPLGGLTELPMWDSDHEWLPMVFDGDPRQFHGVMPYAGDTMLSWSFQRI